jgi:hypothetical protein
MLAHFLPHAWLANQTSNHLFNDMDIDFLDGISRLHEKTIIAERESLQNGVVGNFDLLGRQTTEVAVNLTLQQSRQDDEIRIPAA